MNDHQQRKISQLENELARPTGFLPVIGEQDGYVFTEVDGVTVLITETSRNDRGGYKIPAVRTYPEVHAPTNLDAAVRARELFDNQTKVNYKTGHLGPIVNLDWSCNHDSCRCHSESYAERLKRSVS